MSRNTFLALLLSIGIAVLLSEFLEVESQTTITFKHNIKRVLFKTFGVPTGDTVPRAKHRTATDHFHISSKQRQNMTRTPVYFVSHGGPNIMEDTKHPAHAKLRDIGLEITQKVKPKAVVIFSAHWEGGQNEIEVNIAGSQGLIYDFYGFPPHYYEMTYPNEGSPALAERVLSLLGDAGIKAEGMRRGLDHGVWASFKVMFDPATNPLNCPIVQVSIFGSEDPDQHYALGKAVQSLRDDGIQVLTSGQAVHNLRDMWKAMGQPNPMPYCVTFDEALKDAVEQPVESRQKAMAELLKRPDARKAHPTFDHLLPIHVAAGAAGDDLGKQFFTFTEGSVSWAQYRFGEVGA